MNTKIFYPNKVSQTEGGKYRKFKDLNVIKNAGNGYAVSNGDILGKSKSPNRPSTVTCTDFRCKLPVGAVVNKVTVEVKHAKDGDSNQKSCNIPAPEVSLMYNGHVAYSTHVSSGERYEYVKKGQAAKMVVDDFPVTFNGKATITKKKTIKYEMLSRDVVNSNTFGVRVDYPTNTNNYTGVVKLYWVRVVVDYTLSSFGVSMKKVSGGYNGEDYHLKVSVNRTSKTDYVPSVTIVSPVGATFKGVEGKGIVSQVDNHNFTWKPALSKSMGTSKASVELVFEVNVDYPSGQEYRDILFECAESLNGVTGSHTAHITDRPESTDEDDPTEQKDYYSDTEDISSLNKTVPAIIDEEFEYTFKVDDGTLESFYHTVYNTDQPQTDYETYRDNFIIPSSWVSFRDSVNSSHLSKNEKIKRYDAVNGNWYTTPISFEIEEIIGNDNECTLKLKGIETGYDEIGLRLNCASRIFEFMDTWKFIIKPKEEDLTSPSFTILTPTQEELNRLGDGYTYTAQTYLQEVTTETYVRDWYKNFRIGVYNNPIGTPQIIEVTDTNGETDTIEYDPTDYEILTREEIIENAEYWGNPPTTPNEYANLECQFRYDADYPLYIIITGDYVEANPMASVKYTEPCIIETANYKEWKTNGTFPTPIENLIHSNDTAQLQLQPYTNSNPLIVYDFPVDEDFGTNEDIAIRGVEVTGNIEQSDKITLKAQLKDPNGNTGERSIIISDHDTVVDNDVDFNIGQPGDLWGYGMLDLTQLRDWQVQLEFSNIIEDTQANINLNDIEVTFYTETIEHQNIEVYVNDENISFYNAFITDVNIPPGLETDVDFLNIDGTDTNDAYRQNVKEKTIKLECEVGDNCDLETNTTTLRQLIRLFTNDKDKYNRPIPKQIRFSHYPDVYFEYILKDSPDVEIDINTYSVKFSLVVPSGTSYDINSTVTANTGYIQGLVAVEPIITVTPTDTTIEITETVTGQKFNMGFTGDWIGKIVELDCEDRIVWLKENEEDPDPINISRYVDYNSDWFTLKGEYHFETINSIFKTVSYIERE